MYDYILEVCVLPGISLKMYKQMSDVKVELRIVVEA